MEQLLQDIGIGQEYSSDISKTLIRYGFRTPYDLMTLNHEICRDMGSRIKLMIGVALLGDLGYDQSG